MAFITNIAVRTLSTSASRLAIKNVTVIGGGLMGSGIAQVAAQTGHNVNMVEVNDDLLKNTEGIISKSLGRIVKKKYADQPEEGKKFLSETMGRIKLLTDASAGVTDADLVIEAIVENVGIKRKVFATLDAAAPEKTIFTSNTSSLSISEIAEATSRKDRFGGLHFFNPVPIMKLVEVVRTSNTSDATNTALFAFSDKMGKTAIQAKDTPGFVVNRLLVPYLMEAIKMVERGDATMQDVDLGMKLGTGVPMGPFQLLDFSGLDVFEFVYQGWHSKYPDEQLFDPSPLLTQMVKDGKLGLKSGEGFYSYKKR